MSLETGTKLGPYEILSPLGAGGMGEVYLATDSKLDREAATNVLHEMFSRDPERVRRFQREAKVLASLNHSNIAALRIPMYIEFLHDREPGSRPMADEANRTRSCITFAARIELA